MSSSESGVAPSGNGVLAKRAGVLFLNFFLIILAYYQVKSASRSILIEYWGSGSFPYVWIISALTLGVFIGFYHRLVERYSRLRVVLGSLVIFIALLVVLRLLLGLGSGWAAFAFYIFVDIVSVILVEQFWSLANTVNESDEGKKSYWFVGSGGLIGGALGGKLSSFLISGTPMTTEDLLLSCAALLVIVLIVNLAMGRMGLYREIPSDAAHRSPVSVEGGWQALVRSKYLLLIAGALFCSQFAQPVVEYQFIASVEAAYPDKDQRTVFFGDFFFVLGLVSIAVNLVLTPIIHRWLGVIAGMMVQPLMLTAFSLGFMVQATLNVAAAMKISDRGLSYSINRASKEVLYIPVDPVRTYQAKAWIDMLGYRLFKVAGSAAILLLTQWLPTGLGVAGLGWLTVGICAIWIGIVAMLGREYNSVSAAQPVAA